MAPAAADFSRDPTKRSGDRAVALALVAFALFFRLATLMMIHTGVDERDYWYSAKCLTQGWPYPPLTHRTARFAVILPVAAAQLILGESPNVYYVLPLLNAAIQAALAFAIGARLRGRAAGFLAALSLIAFPYMIRAGSQVRPEIFSITYILAALWCFLAYLERAERGSRRFAPLLGSAALLFVAYEANVTNLFFLPGMGIYMLVRRRPLREILAFGGLLLLLFLAETGLYAALTEFRLGQLQVIARSHLEGNEALKAMSGVGELFRRYAQPYLQGYWQAVFIVFAAAATYFLTKRGATAMRAIVAVASSYFLCMTFAVKSLDPLVPAEPFINRYFCAVLGPVLLVVSVAAVDLASELLARRRKAGSTAKPPEARAYAAFLALAAALVVAVFSAGILPRGAEEYAHSIRGLREHPLAVNPRLRATLDQAWDDGSPIVAVVGLAGSNAIETVASYYLSPDKLERGIRPRPRGIEAGGATYLVLSRDASPSLAGKLLAVARQPFRLESIDAALLPRLAAEALPEPEALFE
jgi:hypothetical protein